MARGGVFPAVVHVRVICTVGTARVVYFYQKQNKDHILLFEFLKKKNTLNSFFLQALNDCLTGGLSCRHPDVPLVSISTLFKPFMASAIRLRPVLSPFFSPPWIQVNTASKHPGVLHHLNATEGVEP